MTIKGVCVAIAIVALFVPVGALSLGRQNELDVMQSLDSESTATTTHLLLRQWWTSRIRPAVGLGDSVSQTWPEFKFSVPLVIGTIIGMFGSALGSVGGVGGGVFYLPMLTFVLGFDAKTSTALSKAMVMGAAIASVAFNLREKHPTETRPVIHYDFAMLFQPMILLGISIGVILNVLLPEWLVTTFLVFLFANLTWNSFKRAIRMWDNEMKIQNDQLISSSNIASSSEESENGDYVDISAYDGVNLALPQNETGITWQWFFWRKMVFLAFVWGIFLALQIIKVYVPDCSFWFWVATLVQLPVAFGATIWEALYQLKEGKLDSDDREEHRNVGNGETKAKQTWLRKLKFSLFGLAAGLMGGLLGVGGGGIMSPAFLGFGLPPQVSSATATFIMVFSSSLSVAEFYLLGRLPRDFAIYFTLTAVVAAGLGQAVIKKMIQASGKNSIIVFILASCCGSGILVLGFIGAQRSYYQWESGANMGFQSLCAPPQG